jgi:hypothetical protein
VENTLGRRLDEYPAWPANIFKLELEGADIYQDRTGEILSDMLDEGEVGKIKISLNGHNIPFITRPENPPPKPDDEIRAATREFNKFLGESSDFAELTAYVALCKVYDEIGADITTMEVLPKGERPHQLNGISNELDGFVHLRNEYIPVEVYNGADYLSADGKYQQLGDYSIDEQPMSNPLLINRRTDSDVNSRVRSELNGMVIDTDVILGAEETHPDLDVILDLFNLDGIVQLLPSLTTDSGTDLVGKDYDNAVTNNPGLIRPPSELAVAADTLPDQYVRRIRGGVQLFYVNSFYRSASERTEWEASLVLQEIYNLLLRIGGMTRQVALDMGWDEFMGSYGNVKSANQRQEMILDQTRDYIQKLLEERVLVEQNNQLHARRATHPQQTFSF